MMILELPQWYDLHAHFRQGPMVPALIRDHLAMGCAGILAMPNTKPPVAKVHESDNLDYWSIEGYLAQLRAAGGDTFDDIIVPLYLTKDTSPAMIAAGAQSGLLRACKYYPPHGTTGAEFGWDFTAFMENGVFAALEEHNIVLCVHGEEHGMSPEDYFGRASNAEEVFYREHMPRLLETFPRLRVVAEHLTTKAGVDLVKQAPQMAASITPQHLIYTVGHLLQGFKYHLYCLPLVKFEEDRAALREAATAADNTQFFAGTDSAPHTTKATPCGCAAGCYTGGIAPQLYAEAFEMAGLDMESGAGQDAFKRFLCLNGPAFYGLQVPEKTFMLHKKPQQIGVLDTDDGPITPLPLGMQNDPEAASVTIPWSVG